MSQSPSSLHISHCNSSEHRTTLKHLRYIQLLQNFRAIQKTTELLEVGEHMGSSLKSLILWWHQRSSHKAWERKSFKDNHSFSMKSVLISTYKWAHGEFGKVPHMIHRGTCKGIFFPYFMLLSFITFFFFKTGIGPNMYSQERNCRRTPNKHHIIFFSFPLKKKMNTRNEMVSL